MNKTLLLIICDFLLLNLLALTRWEKAEPTRPMRTPVPQASTGTATAETDLVETMRLSLADEAAARTELSGKLAEQEQSISRLENDKNQLSTNLEQTRRQAAELDTKLAETAREAEARAERLRQLERDLDLKAAEAARQREQLDALARAEREARERIEGLSVAVRVAEQEKAMLQQTTETLRGQVEAERQERQKVQETSMQLAQGVGQLAEKSGELTREIRENRPINANVLFNEFMANRVAIVMRAEKQNPFLGTVRKEQTTHGVLVSDGTSIYVLLHINETPIGFYDFVSDWNRIEVTLRHNDKSVDCSSLVFVSADPRIIALPLDPSQVSALGAKVYSLVADPFRFPDAMLVNRGGAGYGESPFKLEGSLNTHVRMDKGLFRRLVGDFSPSRGDLVFSKSGDVLGLMASSSHCALVPAFVPSRTIRLGDTKAQNTSKILSEMEARLRSLPFALQ